MKTTLLIALSFAVFSSFAGDNASSDTTWMREGIARQLRKFDRITFAPHPQESGVIAVNSERELSWSGEVRVLHSTGDQVNWIATFPEEYHQNCGNYVLSCQWRRLEHLDQWVLEIFDSTHMGNGSLWLFSLEGHDLRLLLHTTARGRHLQPPATFTVPPLAETRLLEKHLHADYRPAIKGATTTQTILLTGTLVAMDQEDKELSRAPIAETWTWDTKARVFIQAQP